VVASIDYRVGVPDTTAIQKGKAQVRALQDLKSFIRYMKQNAEMVKIDTASIFITGSSAGGATVLGAAYLNYGEQPAYMNPVTAAELQGYGNINSFDASVRAVYSLWGAIGDTSWINAGDIPVGCIQSINDPCIPWDYIASSCNVPGYGIYGSNSVSRRARNLGRHNSLYGFHSAVHDLGLDFPYIDETIAEISKFLYPMAKNK
jgi:hypothetical protein